MCIFIFPETFILFVRQEGVKTENDHINLKVAGQDGSVVQFKIKRHTPLSKLMKAYCERQVSWKPQETSLILYQTQNLNISLYSYLKGLSIRQIRFRFDGQPINETDTPAQVRLFILFFNFFCRVLFVQSNIFLFSAGDGRRRHHRCFPAADWREVLSPTINNDHLQTTPSTTFTASLSPSLLLALYYYYYYC